MEKHIAEGMLRKGVATRSPILPIRNGEGAAMLSVVACWICDLAGRATKHRIGFSNLAKLVLFFPRRCVKRIRTDIENSWMIYKKFPLSRKRPPIVVNAVYICFAGFEVTFSSVVSRTHHSKSRDYFESSRETECTLSRLNSPLILSTLQRTRVSTDVSAGAPACANNGSSQS